MKRWRLWVGEGTAVIEFPHPEEADLVGLVLGLACRKMEEYFEKKEEKENEKMEAMDS